MKQAKYFRSFMSVLLIAAMLLSMTVVGLVGVSAADGPTLSYSFKYDNAGYAEGRVRLTAGSELDYDKYTLYWADDTKVLEGYAPITTLNLNQQSKSFTFGKHTAIPAGATKLIAVESALAVGTIKVADADAVYDIPESKQFKYADSEKEYTFQTLSDIHFHRDGYEAYQYADEHFTSALNAAELRGAEFVSTCGDQTNYNDTKEWGQYLDTLANSNFTGYVYEVNGNHEPYDQGEIPSTSHTNALEQFKVATGLNAGTGKMQPELYFEVTASNGDHHIYMALELVNNKYHPGISDNFTKAQIDWLEGLLNKYKNDGKKIFIYEHAPFAGYGAGDNKVTPHYGAAMTIDAELYPQTYRFKELLEANKDIVWFSGHTHIDFKYNYNIDNENGTSAYSVHVPSTASTTTVNASGGLDYTAKADSAQGYFVDVYKDAVVLNGTDMVRNEILPLYTYLVDYSGEELIENEVEGGEEVNYPKVVVTVDASVFDANSVKVMLYGADDETLSKSVTMTKDTDGLYKANVSTEFTKMKFSVATNSFTINSAEYAVADCTVKLGAYKISFNNTYKWANVNVYAWNTAGGELAAWPGVAMTKEADGTFTAVIPNFPDKIIFNNGSGQTGDLDIAPYITEEIEGSYTLNSTPTPPVEEPSTEYVPDVPVETVTIYLEKPSSWTGAYIYGFYGVVGQTAEKEWPATYPGAAMTLVSGNTYKYDVPADIDYIKFSDGSAANNRTDNIPGSNIGEGVTFGITTKGSKYWNWTTSTKAAPASVGAGVTVYAINSAKWSEMSAYYWGGADVTWPGTAMTKTGETVNGFDVYSVTLDAAPTNIIFNNNNNGSQTGDLTFQAGQYFDVKAGKWYASLSDVPAVDALSTDRYLVGSFNGWSTVADEFKLKTASDKVAYVELDLEAHTTYEFKIVREGTWTSCKTTLQITEDANGLVFSSSVSDNTKITTREAGTYVFAFGLETSQLDVTYPAAEVVPTTTTQAEVEVPTTTTEEVVVPTTAEAEAPADTITVYFTNNRGWSGAYIYGFYGVVGEAATGEPLGAYPGIQMTFVETNGLGQDVYSATIPADIDYIKFSDGAATNNRTDNITNAEFEDSTGFYLQDKGAKYWPYVTYQYEKPEPTPETTATAQVVTGTTAEEITTEEQVIVPTTATQVITTTAEAEAPADTITVYFTNNRGWSGAYIYGFYGVVGETATGEPLGAYPGTEMTFVETNSLGQDIYSATIPADIDYIKFCDGDSKGTNNRTDNIASAEFEDGTGFYLQDKGAKYWPYVTYTYVAPTPEVTTTTEAVVTTATVTATTIDEVVPTTTTEAEAEVPTTVTTTEAEVITTVTNTAEATTEAEIVTTTEAKATATQPKPVEIYVRLGDADQNDKVNVKDATEIQKHIAGLTEADGVIALTEPGIFAANVDSNSSVNVKDVTAIQKYIAGLDVLYAIDQLVLYKTEEVVVPTTSGEADVTDPTTTKEAETQPTTTTKEEVTEPTTTTEEEGTQPTSTTEPDVVPEPTPELKEALAKAKKTLADDYYYASYVAYADLKRVYSEYKDANVAESEQATAAAEVNAALTAFETMKKNNPKHISYNPPKPGSYLIRGTMNNWDESGVMSPDGNGVSITYTLAAGDHKLKVYDTTTAKWYGNGGTFTDTCSGWTMSDGAADLAFKTTGGTYKFYVVYTGGKIQLTVTKQ